MAIHHQELPKINALLNYNRTHRRYARKRTYNIWLDEAVRVGRLDIVNVILRVEILSKPRVLQSTFLSACKKGNAEITAALLGIGEDLCERALDQDLSSTHGHRLWES